MGAQNTRQDQQQSTLQINHQQFKHAKITKQGKRTFMTFTIAVEERQFNKWKDTLQKHSDSSKLKTIQSSQHLLLPTSYTFTSKGLCGSTGFDNITYQFFPFLLVQETQLRQQQKSKFQQAQLWFLLYTLSSAQVEMRNLFNSKIGDVRPQNIFLSEEGDIKILCMYSLPNGLSNYSKAIQLIDTYLAPQEVQRLQKGHQQQQQMTYKTSSKQQIFSIGMTILSTLFLKDCFFLYDLKKPKFNYSKYNQLIGQLRNDKRYSQIFKALVLNLCSIDEERRLSMEELWMFLREYERYIVKKCKFVIKNAPIKIQQTIKQLRREQYMYESKYNSQANLSLNQSSSTVSKKTQFIEYSQQNVIHNSSINTNNVVKQKVVQRVISPVTNNKIIMSPSSSVVNPFNYVNAIQQQKIVTIRPPPSNQIKFHYSNVGEQNNVIIEQIDHNMFKKQSNNNRVGQINNNDIVSTALNNNPTQQQQLKQPQQQQQQPQQQKIISHQTNNNNNHNNNQQQVQAISIISRQQATQQQHKNINYKQDNNNQNYIYTRRVVNIQTNSLLEQQNIDQHQYIQGIQRHISQQQYQQSE